MKIALIGYGKMGQAIEDLAKNFNAKIIVRIDGNSSKKEFEKIKDADVCIDFTNPKAFINNLELLVSFKKPIVVGTTGWYDHLKTVDVITEEKQRFEKAPR